MTNDNRFFSVNALNMMMDDGLIVKQKHNNADLYIYNYTPKTQYNRIWNSTTKQCRGLILDGDYNIVALPFPKFFNLEEIESNDMDISLPETSFEVYDKLDGSLGILYWLDDKPYIATRGSFHSDQAIHATNILYGRYSHTFDKLDRNKTYLFEIIYPENRIVVDYGETDDIVLIAIIDNLRRCDCELVDIGFPIVKKYDGINDISELKFLNQNNKEGFIIKFSNDFRVKLKFEEYIRLHRIITNVSNKVIWEYLSQGKEMDELLDRVPDEFYDWVKNTKNKILSDYEKIENGYKMIYKMIMKSNGVQEKKVFASYATRYDHPSILFNMYDRKDYSKFIWKIIKPKYEKPFSNYILTE
jgi:RNA ligase